MLNTPFWLNAGLTRGRQERLVDGSVLIIGSGFSGVGSAYWLLKRMVKDLVLVDFECEKAASFRNCGHILFGTVESMQALVALHGYAVAKELWDFSTGACLAIKETIEELHLDCEYKQDGYLCVAIDETENREIKESIRLLNEMGFQSDYFSSDVLNQLGFKNALGARFEAGSAQAHPVKFRNGVLEHCLKQGLKYFSDIEIIGLDENANGVTVKSSQGLNHYDAVVIAGNAYSPLFSDFFQTHRLLEPFRGQIITSKPLAHQFPVRYPHSFDHGYEYAIVSADNRLIIGGWRNHTPTKEIGTYKLDVNLNVNIGLQQFVHDHYQILEKIEWEYAWTGIMASSKTALPFIGPTASSRIYCCAGYTGHGFSWAHGSARLLSQIILGDKLPTAARLFNPLASRI